MVPAFLRRRDYPNLGMCGGLLAQGLILLQTPFVHLVVKQICDWAQLIKVGAVPQSYFWALSVSTRDSLLFPLPGFGMKAEFQSLLSQTAETIHGISRTALLLCQPGVSCDVGTPGNIIRPGSGLLSSWVRHDSLLLPAVVYSPSYLPSLEHAVKPRSVVCTV